MTKNRRWLYVMLAGGLIAVGAGGGTFATFNAQVTNKTNAFSTGSLVLTDATCHSFSGTTNAKTCSGILSVTTSGEESTSVVFSTITLKDGGSLTAGKFSLAAAKQTGTTYCKTTVTTTLGTLNTSTNLCTGLRLFVEEVGQTGAGTKTYCWYGGSTHTLCGATAKLKTALTEGTSYTTLKIKTTTGSFTTGDKVVVTTKTGSHTEAFTVASGSTATTLKVTTKKALASFVATSYVMDVTHLTTADTVKSFDTTHRLGTTSHPAIRLLALTTSGHPVTATSAPDLKAGKSRKFLVGVFLGTVGNTYQGLTAKFGLTWRITQ